MVYLDGISIDRVRRLRTGIFPLTSGEGGGGDVSGRPSGLKIKSASDAVDVNALADEIESGDDATFHASEVDGAALNPAGGDEFIFVGGLASSLETRGLQGIYEVCRGGFGEVTPCHFIADAATGDDSFPEATWNGRNGSITNELGTLVSADF